MVNLQIAAYQPDIAANFGSLLRLTACLQMPLHVIEPCGFPLDNQRLRRSAMDYVDLAQMQRHMSWEHFLSAQRQQQHRIILLTTKAADIYTDFRYQSGDILLLGRESAGVPEAVHTASDARVYVPMHPEARSLNVVQSACIVAGEALRQTGHFNLSAPQKDI